MDAPLSEAESLRLRYASFVIAKLRIVYVETPKVACTSFKHLVAALGEAHPMERLWQSAMGMQTPEQAIHDRALVNLPSLPDLSPQERARLLAADDVVRFCVVRNPYHRLASAWADRMLMHTISPLVPAVKHLGLPRYEADWGYLRARFAEFVDYLYRHEAPRFSNHHWQTMIDLLLPARLRYNLIIRLEDFATGLSCLIDHVERQGGTWPGLPRFNETPMKGALHLYTAAVARKVREMYADDFAAFGYDPAFVAPCEPPPPLPSPAFVRAMQKRNQRVLHLSLRLRGML